MLLKKYSLEEVTNMLAQTSCANGVYLSVSMQTYKDFLEKSQYLQIGDGEDTIAWYRLEFQVKGKAFGNNWGRMTEQVHSSGHQFIWSIK